MKIAARLYSACCSALRAPGRWRQWIIKCGILKVEPQRLAVFESSWQMSCQRGHVNEEVAGRINVASVVIAMKHQDDSTKRI